MTNDGRAANLLRKFFKLLNRYMVLHWRLGLGPLGNRPDLAGCIMVLIHRGRKTGKQRRTPVNYARIDGDFYCVAGFGQISDWYRNLMATPQAEVWAPEGWYGGAAEDVSDWPAGRRAPILRAVLYNSGFAGRAAGIDALRMSDAELLAAAADYRLVRIHNTEPRTGPGGPGDLVWMWPVLATKLAVITGWLLLRGRKSRSD
jgi:deazaflavin-dependent oxidoreductase (nitroreductase family)